ncbi:MAG TPA: class I SAM-dependent methyltransferase [Phycisphaerae bacterium]|nr:class I SAM-dependent methyltransferase [Phycisphaerae bacterium]
MDDTLIRVIADCAAFIDGRDDALALTPDAADFVYTLLRATGAKRGLEIGTSYGFSGLHIGGAIAQNGGTLTTIDKQPHKTEKAREFFAMAGLDQAIQCEIGNAREIIARLRGPFDFVLNDADKNNCRTYLEILLPKLESGAVVLTDNTISHAEELADFMAWARKCPDLKSVELPIGNGFEMSVRR